MANPLRAAAAAFDRGALMPLRWARLRATLDASGADALTMKRAVQAELRIQAAWHGPHVPTLPAWARDAVLFTGTPGEGVTVRAPVRTPDKPARAISDAAALRALVVHLHAHRDRRVSEEARAWAVYQPGLGKDWADGAIKRLGAAGILVKRRGEGRANLPAWHLVELNQALGSLSKVPGPPKG